jgi:mevalonate kinase
VRTYFSHGKLLLTGEYFVLDGALALAVPTKLGQSLGVKFQKSDFPVLNWKSFDSSGELWYSQDFRIEHNGTRKLTPIIDDGCNIDSTTDRLALILNETLKLNPNFLFDGNYEVQAHLDFPANWGLGSSSTLICNIAKWAEVDAFEISNASFGGSGYDIAVGMMGCDVLYRSPELWEGYVFNPPFKDQIYFVHLNKKQNSREAVKNYKSIEVGASILEEVSNITDMISVCEDFDQFQELVTRHESLVSEVLNMQTVKQKLFSDYPFAIKSLGAWGGDFILACGDEKTPQYFKDKGYDVVLPFSKLIK